MKTEKELAINIIVALMELYRVSLKDLEEKK